jgi:hypothetical protein
VVEVGVVDVVLDHTKNCAIFFDDVAAICGRGTLQMSESAF